MKKLLLLLVPAFLLTGLNDVQAQAKKYALFEHFTQASCGPCAAQNPGFQALFFENTINAHHVAFHTSWPGVDPMYNHNPAESNAMVQYYNVTGVPTIVYNGESLGLPASVTQELINSTGLSPVRVLVDENVDSTTVTGTVEIQVLDELPNGVYKLRLAAVEALIEYNSPPGSNGEKVFPNVFRKFVGAGLNGEVLNLEQGETYTYNFEYDIDEDWAFAEMYTLAWVYNNSTKEVLNSGVSSDAGLEYFNTAENPFQASDINGNNFTSKIINLTDNTKNVEIAFTVDHPADWNASYTVLGNSYTETTTIAVEPGEIEIDVIVEPGTSSAIGNYTLSITEQGSNQSQSSTYSVIANVSDLIFFRPTDGVDIESPYYEGLEYAGSTTFASVNDGNLANALNSGALEDVNNIYYSIGWNFPALNPDVSTALMQFMDNGGNVLIAGQDIGWDTFDPQGNSNNSINKNLINNYFYTNYVDDGSASRNQFIAEEDDVIYGNVATSDITRPYGASYLYPDRVRANDPVATEIFHYNNPLHKAAVRSDNGTHKSVYIGLGLEHIKDTDISDEIMKLTHDWFNGLISSTEFDQAVKALQMGQSFPNPSDFEAVIPFEGQWKSDMTLQITNLNGQIVERRKVAAGTSALKLNTADMPAGIYFYQLTDGADISTPQKFIVAH